VVVGGAEDQLAQELAGGGLDDAAVVVLNEQQDLGSGMRSGERGSSDDQPAGDQLPE
jgi:hypothetical protein